MTPLGLLFIFPLLELVDPIIIKELNLNRCDSGFINSLINLNINGIHPWFQSAWTKFYCLTFPGLTQKKKIKQMGRIDSQTNLKGSFFTRHGFTFWAHWVKPNYLNHLIQQSNSLTPILATSSLPPQAMHLAQDRRGHVDCPHRLNWRANCLRDEHSKTGCLLGLISHYLMTNRIDLVIIQIYFNE